jgi:hypothetical protein
MRSARARRRRVQNMRRRWQLMEGIGQSLPERGLSVSLMPVAPTVSEQRPEHETEHGGDADKRVGCK